MVVGQSEADHQVPVPLTVDSAFHSVALFGLCFSHCHQ